MNLGSLLFGFRGRIDRAQYWLSLLAVIVVLIGISVAGVLVGSEDVLWAFFAAGAIVTLVPTIAIPLCHPDLRRLCGFALEFRRTRIPARDGRTEPVRRGSSSRPLRHFEPPAGVC